MEKNKNFLDQFIHGSQLKSYEFKKYKTKKNFERYEFNVSYRSKNFRYNKDKRFRVTY